MEIPKMVYHGTFWPDNIQRPTVQLRTDVGYVCTSEFYGEAEYFARLKRRWYKDKAGILTIYEIFTPSLPEEVIKGCIPPDGIDPRAFKIDCLMKIEKDMVAERMRIQEWRFPFIPLEAILTQEERYLRSNPSLSLFGV